MLNKISESESESRQNISFSLITHKLFDCVIFKIVIESYDTLQSLTCYFLRDIFHQIS